MFIALAPLVLKIYLLLLTIKLVYSWTQDTIELIFAVELKIQLISFKVDYIYSRTRYSRTRLESNSFRVELVYSRTLAQSNSGTIELWYSRTQIYVTFELVAVELC